MLYMAETPSRNFGLIRVCAWLEGLEEVARYEPFRPSCRATYVVSMPSNYGLRERVKKHLAVSLTKQSPKGRWRWESA